MYDCSHIMTATDFWGRRICLRCSQALDQEQLKKREEFFTELRELNERLAPVIAEWLRQQTN